MMKRKTHMETGKYLVLLLINFILIFTSCNDYKSSASYSMLEDITSNCYYIPIKIEYEGLIYEVVIPNDRLYSILNQFYGNELKLNSYIKLIEPVLKEQGSLPIENNVFEKINPYIIPKDWNFPTLEKPEMFYENIQNGKINNELILIRQLFESGYIVYKDDETGLLVRKEYSNL